MFAASERFLKADFSLQQATAIVVRGKSAGRVPIGCLHPRPNRHEAKDPPAAAPPVAPRTTAEISSCSRSRKARSARSAAQSQHRDACSATISSNAGKVATAGRTGKLRQRSRYATRGSSTASRSTRRSLKVLPNSRAVPFQTYSQKSEIAAVSWIKRLPKSAYTWVRLERTRFIQAYSGIQTLTAARISITSMTGAKASNVC